LSQEWKSEGVMDGATGESTEREDICGRSRKTQVRASKTGMRSTERIDSRDKLRHIERNDQLYVTRVHAIGGRARVTRDEERVLRGG